MIVSDVSRGLFQMVSEGPPILEEVTYAAIMVVFKAKPPLFDIKFALNCHPRAYEVGEGSLLDGTV